MVMDVMWQTSKHLSSHEELASEIRWHTIKFHLIWSQAGSSFFVWQNSFFSERRCSSGALFYVSGKTFSNFAAHKCLGCVIIKFSKVLASPLAHHGTFHACEIKQHRHQYPNWQRSLPPSADAARKADNPFRYWRNCVEVMCTFVMWEDQYPRCYLVCTALHSLCVAGYATSLLEEVSVCRGLNTNLLPRINSLLWKQWLVHISAAARETLSSRSVRSSDLFLLAPWMQDTVLGLKILFEMKVHFIVKFWWDSQTRRHNEKLLPRGTCIPQKRQLKQGLHRLPWLENQSHRGKKALTCIDNCLLG